MRLTALQIEKLPVPTKGQKTYWEGGFGVRVSQGGTKSYVVMYGRDRTLKTIGRHPAMSLKTARRTAQAILDDPQSLERPRTLAEALEAYLVECDAKLRPGTVDSYRHHLRHLRGATFASLSRKDTLDTAHAVSAAKTFLTWCIRNGLTDRNPWQHETVKYGQRERVLTHEEIKQLWQYDYPPFSDKVKLMLLTGMRKSETNHCELTDDLLTIEGAHTKNHRTHQLPLTPMVSELVPVPYFNGWSKAKARLDTLVPLPHWTLHDLRRTFATEHAKIGTAIHIVEALLNHRSGTVSGVAAIYIRHNFLDAARTAQLAYEKHLTDIVGA